MAANARSNGASTTLLRTSEERFGLFVQGVRDYGIFMLDPQGRVMTWNEGAERIKGWTAKEIVGQHFSRFYPQEALDRGWPAHELEVATREGRFEDEGWRVRKDGGQFWANVVITAVRDADGTLLGFAKVTRDLTERRKHEEAIRQSEERFRLLIESVTDYAIFMLDASGHVVSWNRGAERIKGYTAQEIIGQHLSRFYPREAVERGWPDHELSVARREGRFEDEGWRLRKDGTRFWANVVITAVFDGNGVLRGFAKITRDLTERRKIEELQQEGRQTQEFLAMLGHELRNPLAPIRNAVAVLRTPGASAAMVQRAHDVIDRQAGHLAHIVDDLLDVGRITTGKLVVQKDPVDLRRLVTQAAEAAGPLLDAKEQRLNVALPATVVRVAGDATRLSQVASNLLGNANKYTQRGGTVWIDLETDGPFAELRVRDDGMGLSPELLPRVFELFTQGDRALDRSEGGLGIGLTVVKKLVELHGGTVSASSAGPGRGSCFVVRLPLLATPPTAGAAAAAPAEVPDARPLRVLVVDDNEDSADTIAMLLGLWGCEVRTANDGPGALAAVEEFQPEAVMLDIGLPGMSGYEVAQRIRSMPSVPYLVAVTGYGQPEDERRAREAGFVEHLVKPVQPETLQKLVARLAPKR